MLLVEADLLLGPDSSSEMDSETDDQSYSPIEVYALTWHGYTAHIVRTPILSHTDLACNTSYHFAASRTVFPRVPPYLAQDRLRLLAHVYDSAASIHMIKNPG